MTILITGAFGFVGTNLSAYLAERGHELWALDVESVGNKQWAVGTGQSVGCEEGFRQGARAQRGSYERCFSWNDLGNIPWQDVGAVIHLAGKAHDTRSVGDPQSYFDVNVGLTQKVLESAMGNGQSAAGNGGDSRQGAKAQRDCLANMTEGQKGAVVAASAKSATSANQLTMPQRFVLFSSVKAVADRVEGVLTEEAVPTPQTPYGQSKLEAEKAVISVWGRSSVPACAPTNERLYYILRPCMIHGPGNKGNLNLLYGVVRKGIPWPLGAFENKRSFASIGNVCAVVDAVLKESVPSGVYQVADDEPLSTNALIGLMAESLKKRARIWRVSANLIRFAARCGDVLHLPLNSERLKKLTESYMVSNAKIKSALGWNRMPLRAEEGMRKTLESFFRKGAKSPRN